MKKSFILIVLIASQFFSQPLHPFVKQIPMRDGKWLAADCYVNDTTGATKYPVILIQTPYNRLRFRYGLPLGIGTDIASCPYAFVIVDWRGFYGSALAAVPGYDRGKDGYDVIDWIVQQPWSNGKVGTWGPSALGEIQYQTAAKYHPAHVCAAPLVAAPMFNYRDYYPGGVLRTEYVEQLDSLGYGLSPLLLSHPYYDIYWYYAELKTFYPDSIHIPMFLIGGWFDHNIQDMLDFFQALQTQSDPQVRHKHKFLIGPWEHGGHGVAYVGSTQAGELNFPEVEGWSDSLTLRFFDYYLRGISNGWENEATIRYFVPQKNIWDSCSSWEARVALQDTITLYLHDDGKLNNLFPSSSAGNLSFTYDPHDPSPTIGGMTLRSDLLQGPYDQSQLVESRNDILIFSTEELSMPVTVQGGIKVILYVSSDAKDTDFALRLTDVSPDGRSILLREQIQRMRFRKGFTQADETFMENDSIYRIELKCEDIAYTFTQGHKIRLDITSSNYPRYDLNLNNGGPMYTAGDTIVAHNKVYCNALYPSKMIVPADQFPVSIQNINPSEIDIYPNPACDYLQISSKNFTPTEWHVYDASGKEVFHSTAKNQIDLNVTSWRDGLYVVLGYGQNNEIFQKTFMILH